MWNIFKDNIMTIPIKNKKIDLKKINLRLLFLIAFILIVCFPNLHCFIKPATMHFQYLDSVKGPYQRCLVFRWNKSIDLTNFSKNISMQIFYDEYGRKIEEREYNYTLNSSVDNIMDTTKYSSKKFYYNTYGDIKRIEKYDRNDLYKLVDFIYKNNKLEKKVFYNINHNEKYLDKTEFYLYDKNGRLIHSYRNATRLTETSNHKDVNNNINLDNVVSDVLELSQPQNVNITCSRIYGYDNLDNLIVELNYENNVLITKDIYNYDINRNLVDITSYYCSSVLFYKCLTYDKLNRVIEEQIEDNMEYHTSSDTFFEYDRYGNVTLIIDYGDRGRYSIDYICVYLK